MNNLKGKTAFITGAADGIGFHTARALAKEGMNIMLADINASKLAESTAVLRQEGFNVDCVELDVALAEQWEVAVNKTTSVFGNVHFVMNNAGVSVVGSLSSSKEKDWRWLLDVNLMGVVFGCKAFFSHMKAHGEGAHIMNVASMAGVLGVAYGGAYCATKAAVVSLSESWRAEFAKDNIEVSVLCPGFVKTGIYDSARNRPDRFGGASDFEKAVKERTAFTDNKEDVMSGIDTELAANRVVEGLTNNEFYIFTHPEFRQFQVERAAAIQEAFDRAEASPALKQAMAETES
ncbi:SDR family NAD(P)-dependent oxidoreductase [Oceaniserpentilla sp. 4NH20-0058]|uniref:SDR family NAD(P)-dependent oxidoreductase n=1 Tax=Oceaniserpentilla sp. 4NH20-0058 TaxID=3127660 RepID=UPI003103CE9C